MSWKLVVASFAAGVLAVSVGVASAASLGVLDAGSLGTSSQVIAACDDTVGLSWDVAGSPTYSGNATAANSTFTVTKMALINVDASCDGSSYKLAIANSAGTALVSQSGTLSVVSGTATFTFAAQDSKLIDQVTVTIYE